jgi:hypothetical protein
LLELQRFAAGGQHRDARAPVQQQLYDRCDGRDHVLAVIQDKQQFAVGKFLSEHLGRVGPGLGAQPDAGHDRRRDQAGIEQRRECDEPCAVAPSRADGVGDLRCQSGLAHAPGSGQRDQPRLPRDQF